MLKELGQNRYQVENVPPQAILAEHADVGTSYYCINTKQDGGGRISFVDIGFTIQYTGECHSPKSYCRGQHSDNLHSFFDIDKQGGPTSRRCMSGGYWLISEADFQAMLPEHGSDSTLSMQ